MDICDTLRDDHKIIGDCLTEIENLDGGKPATSAMLFGESHVFPVAHARAEEQVAHAERLKHDRAADVAREGAAEPVVADSLLPVIADLNPEDPCLRTRFAVLKEAVVHHLDEEEKELFRAARMVLAAETADALGPCMDRQRDVLLGG